MKEVNLIVAMLGGSRLYGTDRPDSDVDIRGVCHSPRHALLGLQGFEQYQPKGCAAEAYSIEAFGPEFKSNDVTIYALPKFFMLCLKANPGLLEMLFVPDSKTLYTSPVWARIKAKREIFLSTKAVHTFAGYAYNQLKRIERHKAWLDNPPTEPDPYEYGLVVETEKGHREWGKTNQKNVYRKLQKNWKQYETWRKNRNPARAKLEAKYGYDSKYAAHIFRLACEASELLLTGEIVLPLRTHVRETYIEVLNGGVDYEAVVAKARGLKEELLALEDASVLPKRPNHKAAEELLMELQWDALQRGGGSA